MSLLPYFSHPPVYVQRLTSLFPPPPSAPSGHSFAVMVLLFTTECLMLIFALPWLSVLLVVVHIISHSPFPSVPSIVSVTNDFTPFFFLIFILNLLPSPSLSPFLLLSLLLNACDVCIGLFGVTNHPLQNLRAKSKHPPTQKPCITIGCFLLATTYLALCLLLCVRPLACPALP